jgi:chromosome segregation ATPase
MNDNLNHSFHNSVHDAVDERDLEESWQPQEFRHLLALARSHIADLETENSQLFGYCQDFKLRDEQLTNELNNYSMALEETREMLHESETKIQNLISERDELKQELETTRSRMHYLRVIILFTKKQGEEMEKDFELFATRIKSQQVNIQDLQDENSSLRASLRVHLF